MDDSPLDIFWICLIACDTSGIPYSRKIWWELNLVGIKFGGLAETSVKKNIG